MNDDLETKLLRILRDIATELEGIRLALSRPAPRRVGSVAWRVGAPADEAA